MNCLKGARNALDFEEFIREFVSSRDRRDGLTRISSHWNVDETTTFDYLSKVHLYTIDELQLRRLNRNALTALFDYDATQAMLALLDILATSVHKQLSRREVWERLGELGIGAARDAEYGPPGYLLTLRENLARTPELDERESEIEDLVNHSLQGDGYLLCVGAPWAGKTALMAHAMEAVSQHADVVFFFTTRRTAQADSTEFLEAVIPQLDWIGGARSTGRRRSPSQFKESWNAALRSSDRRGRRLVLFVDGLDEEERLRKQPSIASLLPVVLGDGATVIVSTRPNPELPPDVDVDHPIRLARRVDLVQTQATRQLEMRATLEVDGIFADRSNVGGEVGVAHQTLCALVAAGGPLAAADLARITNCPSADVEAFVRWSGARLLESTSDGRLRFAHQTILDVSKARMESLGDAERSYRAVDDWADQWRKVDWPLSTPEYLLREYPIVLLSRDAERAVDLVQDSAWLSAAIRKTGVRASIATLVRVQSAVTGSEAIRTLLRIVELEAPALAQAKIVDLDGYVERQLAYGSLKRNVDLPVIAQMRARVAASADGVALMPEWTTESVPDGLVRRDWITNGKRPVLAISSDGSKAFVASSGSGHVLEWDIESGDTPRLLREFDEWIFGLTISGDGTRLAVVSQTRLQVLDVATGSTVWALESGGEDVVSVALDRAGTRIAISNYTDELLVVDLSSSESRMVVECRDVVLAAAFPAESGELVCIDAQANVEVWDLFSGQSIRCRSLCADSQVHWHTATLSLDGDIASVVCPTGAITTVRVSPGSPLNQGMIDVFPLNLAVDSGCGVVALLDDVGLLHVWDGDSRELRTLGQSWLPSEGEDDDGWAVPVVAVSSGVVIVGVPGGEVSVWDASAMSIHDLSESSPTLVAAAGSSVLIVDEEEATLRTFGGDVLWQECLPLPDPIAIMGATGNGLRALTIGESGALTLWELGAEPAMFLLDAPIDGPSRLAIAGERYALVDAAESLFIVPLSREGTVWEVPDMGAVRSIAAARHVAAFAVLTMSGSIIYWLGSDIRRPRARASVYIEEKPKVLALSGDGSTVFVADASGDVYSWKPGSVGLTKSVNGDGEVPVALSVDSVGRRGALLVDSGRVYTLDFMAGCARAVNGIDDAECTYVDARFPGVLVLGLKTGIAVYSLDSRRLLARAHTGVCNVIDVGADSGTIVVVTHSEGGVTAWRVS